MKKLTIYETRDGARFDDEAAALRHGRFLDDIDVANEMFSNGATLLASLTRAHQTNPDWDKDLVLGDRSLLTAVNKDTSFGGPSYFPGLLACGCTGVTGSGVKLMKSNGEEEIVRLSILMDWVRVVLGQEASE